MGSEDALSSIGTALMNACTEYVLKAGYEQIELVYLQTELHSIGFVCEKDADGTAVSILSVRKMQMELQYRFWL